MIVVQGKTESSSLSLSAVSSELSALLPHFYSSLRPLRLCISLFFSLIPRRPRFFFTSLFRYFFASSFPSIAASRCL